MRRSLFIIALLLCTLSAAATANPAKPRLGHFPSFGSALTYEMYGSGPATWIALAGGPGYEPRYLKPLIPHLLTAGRRIVLFHQRGTGLSHAADKNTTRLTVAGEIADLEGLRVALHLAKLHLIGHSWGGYLALAYAARYPQRVAVLVILDGLGDDPRSWLPITEEMLAALTPKERAAALRACTSMRPSGECDFAELPSLFYDHSKIGAFLKRIPGPDAPNDNVRVNDPVTFDIVRKPHLNALRDTLIPALLVFGSEDPYREPALHDNRALMPAAKVAIIAKSGHFTWFEQPAQFDRIVPPFLAAHDF